MYAVPQNATSQQAQGYAVAQPQQIQSVQQYQYQQNPQPQSNGSQLQQQTPDQYYYYGGGEGNQLTDITPTQQMIQNQPVEEGMNNENNVTSPKLIENGLVNEKPISPALLYNIRTSTYSMPIRNIEISISFHIATAFVSLKITFQNVSNTKVNTLFVLPCNGTVTSTKVNINNGSRYLDTTFIDNDSAKQFQPKQRKTRNQNEVNQPINAYIPNVFRLPIADIAKNESVTVEVDYMESLKFVESRYHLFVPFNFGNGILPNNNKNNISIKCSINCITPGIQYGSTTHRLILTEQKNLRCKLYAQPKQLTNNRDFHLFYSVKTNAICAALLCDKGSEYEYDPLKSFTCFVNPPTQMTNVFQRDIIFLLDRSGSMTGKPFEDAVRGLTFALHTLTQYDRFGIIAFDHQQIIFDPRNESNGFGNEDLNHNNFQLFPAFPSTIQQSIKFLKNISARGMTDIKTPLMKAIHYLNNSNQPSIPFICLLTDGAVENEKEIAKELSALDNNKTRILTFGIGQYCNEFFLKMLSLLTRGWHDGCIYPTELFPKIRLMMSRAKTPILTDIQLEMPNHLSNVEIYPKTIPDLFMNGPITISGKYSGNMPSQIVLKGKLQNGQILAIPIRADFSDIIPINKIFLKQRMDQLNAEYWLSDDLKIKQQIIDISINETFPSPYTSMVAYELSPKEKKEQDTNQKKKSSGLSGTQIAALTGGAVVIGAGIFCLGNVAATMGNIGIIDGIGNVNIFGGIDSVDCCPCGDCLDILPCGDCNICGSCGGIVGGVGDTCQCIPGCIGGIGDFCGNIGDVFGGVCGCIGEIGGGIGDIAGGVCECLGSAVTALTDLA